MEEKNCVCNKECLDKVMYLKDSVYDYRKNLHCIAEEGRVIYTVLLRKGELSLRLTII